MSRRKGTVWAKLKAVSQEEQIHPWKQHSENLLGKPPKVTDEDGDYTRMLRAILNKSLRQHSSKQQLHGYLPPITKTIQVRQTKHTGHCWWSKDELINDVLLWTPAHGRAKVGPPARTYIQQLRADTGCSLEDLPRAIDEWGGWQERVREIHASSAAWWWWWWWKECISYFDLWSHTSKRDNMKVFIRQVILWDI